MRGIFSVSRCGTLDAISGIHPSNSNSLRCKVCSDNHTKLGGDVVSSLWGLCRWGRSRNLQSWFRWSSLWGALRLMAESSWWPDLRPLPRLRPPLGSPLVWIPVLPHPSCVIKGNSVSLSEAQVPHLNNVDVSALFGGLLWRLNEWMHNPQAHMDGTWKMCFHLSCSKK